MKRPGRRIQKHLGTGSKTEVFCVWVSLIVKFGTHNTNQVAAIPSYPGPPLFPGLIGADT